jgi:hypothetical protein
LLSIPGYFNQEELIDAKLDATEKPDERIALITRAAIALSFGLTFGAMGALACIILFWLSKEKGRAKLRGECCAANMSRLGSVF